MTETTANNVIQLPGTAEAELDLKNRTELLLGEIASNMLRGKKTREVMEFLRREAEDKGVADSECAKSALSKMKLFSWEHWLSISGSIGEKEALKATKALNVDSTIITNLEFEWENQRNEIDQIIITKSCLMLIEVKNYSKDVEIDEYGVIRFADGRGDLCYNVGERLRAKEYALYGILSQKAGISIDRKAIRGVMLFTNDRSQIHDHFGAAKLCGKGTICAYIESLQENSPVFDEDQMKIIENALVSAHSPLEPNEQSFDDLVESVKELVQLITPAEDNERDATHEKKPAEKKQGVSLSENVRVALGVIVGFAAGSTFALAFDRFRAIPRQV